MNDLKETINGVVVCAFEILTAISALISIVCAVVILNSPFTSTAVLWTFTGATLIVEAAFDIVALLFGRKRTSNTAHVEAE